MNGDSRDQKISADSTQIRQLHPYASGLYSGIDHDRLIAFVIKRLSELNAKASFENITACSFRLFPDVFGLEGYPEYPDGARVNRTLLHCQPKYKNYVNGRAITGYVLTERGLTAANETVEMLQSPSGQRHKGRAKAPRSSSERMEREIRESEAFLAWKSGRPIAQTDFFLFLHLMPGSGATALRENISVIVESLDDRMTGELKSFFNSLSVQFSKELGAWHLPK